MGGIGTLLEGGGTDGCCVGADCVVGVGLFLEGISVDS